MSVFILNSHLYFLLYAHNIPVAGADGAAIYDLSSGRLLRIPLVLISVLCDLRVNTVEEIKNLYTPNEPKLIDKYLKYLYDNDWGFFTDSPKLFPELDFENYDIPCEIYNAVLDSGAHLPVSILQLDECNCKFIELRLISPFLFEELSKSIEQIDISGIVSVSIIVITELSERENELFLTLTSRSRKITNVCVYDDLKCHKRIDESLSCGSPTFKSMKRERRSFGLPKLLISRDYYAESLKHDPYRNKKVYIDCTGNIYNIPEDSDILGNVFKMHIRDVLKCQSYRTKTMRRFDPENDSCLTFASILFP